MKMVGCVLLGLALAGFVAASAFAAKPAHESAHHEAKLLAHGKYLVTRAVPCSDCHSPRDSKGQLISGRELQGAPIGFKPLHPMPGWVTAAPAIARLPQGWSLKQTVHFLETGVMPGGGHAGPPMPEFRFNHYDATAIATYLQSLPGPKEDKKH